MRNLAYRALAVTTTIAALLILTAAAEASITPSITLDQSSGRTAGSTTNLGLDLRFADTGTDSPHNLTINLPPGLLANASINGGSCLKTANTSGTACQVGSGTVTATADPIPPLLNLPVPVSVPVSFYLVPPPAPGDLAGLAVEGLGEQIGPSGDIRVRPTGDPNGVGVTIKLALPDQLPLTLPHHRPGSDRVHLADRDQQHVRPPALPDDLSGDRGTTQRDRRLLRRSHRPHGYRATDGDRVLVTVLFAGVQSHRHP